MKHYFISIGIVFSSALLITMAGCSPNKASKNEDKGAAEVTKTPPAPTKPIADAEKEPIAISMIAIVHKDSKANTTGITRTKEEAHKRIEEAMAKLKKGADFGEIAKAYSDHPSKTFGGDLGNVTIDGVPPEIIEQVSALKVGEISSQPFENEVGFHIFKRQEPTPVIKMSISMIAIMHKDLEPNPLNITRTKEEAMAMAKEALAKIKAGEDFAGIAKQYSDHPNKAVGGDMGVMQSDMMPVWISKEIQALTIGGVTPEIVDSPVGFHIFKRQEPIEKPPISASMILVAHKDSMINRGKITRTKEEALAIANGFIKKLQDGADFSKLADEHSEHPMKKPGGNFGSFKQEQMPPDIIAELLTLKTNEISKKPLDTPIGYFILKRQSTEDKPL